MNNAPADDTRSGSTSQRAMQRAIRFPIEQTMRFQTEAAQLFVDSIETGSAVQQRGLSLATDLARNYARTLERTTRDAGEFATASADAFQSPAIAGGQQPPGDRQSQPQTGQQTQQPTPPQQMATPQPTPPQQMATPQATQYSGQQATQQFGQQPSPQQYQSPQPQQQQFDQPQYGQQQPQYGGQQAPTQQQSQPLQQAPPQQTDQFQPDQSAERFETPIQQ